MTKLFTALTGATNASQPLPNLATSGQPTQQHFEALQAAGAQVIIDLRDPAEARPFNEPAVVTGLGMEYINIPIGPSTPLDDALMDRILTVLRSHANVQAVMHCASANRVGGALIPYLVIDQKMEPDDAIDAAQRIGLRSPEYVDWALGYIERHGG
ncbi:MAG TPA: hypothetical protein VG817_11415 [Gemmatimonadales bacterium]|nr:hypothetical protein [Gemmatimonadales bacterium]